jgi:hypothetical protein
MGEIVLFIRHNLIELRMTELPVNGHQLSSDCYTRSYTIVSTAF